MICRELAELLIDFISGELPAERHQRVQEHLVKCPPCVIFMETYQMTIRITRKLPCRPMPPALVERLQKALDEFRTGGE
jgi:anti-sigma factor RsiW